MDSSAILISIHPCYADKIISGEKRLEFRRQWASRRADVLVIYATHPVKRIVAIAEVQQIIIGSRWKMWELAKSGGGGITRNKLFTYLDGKVNAVAIELKRIVPISGGADPRCIFGGTFRPPQSFRYLKKNELLKLGKLMAR